KTSFVVGGRLCCFIALKNLSRDFHLFTGACDRASANGRVHLRPVTTAPITQSTVYFLMQPVNIFSASSNSAFIFWNNSRPSLLTTFRSRIILLTSSGFVPPRTERRSTKTLGSTTARHSFSVKLTSPSSALISSTSHSYSSLPLATDFCAMSVAIVCAFLK